MYTQQDRLEHCKRCENAVRDFKTGLTCKLSGKKPDFDYTCDFFKEDVKYNEQLKARQPETFTRKNYSQEYVKNITPSKEEVLSLATKKIKARKLFEREITKVDLYSWEKLFADTIENIDLSEQVKYVFEDKRKQNQKERSFFIGLSGAGLLFFVLVFSDTSDSLWYLPFVFWGLCFGVGVLLDKFKPITHQRVFELNRKEQHIKLSDPVKDVNYVIPFDQVYFYRDSTTTPGAFSRIQDWLVMPEPNGNEQVLILPHLGIHYCNRVEEGHSIILWYMDKNRPLPPGKEFDPFRKSDFERRKAEGFPPPLFESSFPTPEATDEWQTEREKHWKDEDFLVKEK